MAMYFYRGVRGSSWIWGAVPGCPPGGPLRGAMKPWASNRTTTCARRRSSGSPVRRSPTWRAGRTTRDFRLVALTWCSRCKRCAGWSPKRPSVKGRRAFYAAAPSPAAARTPGERVVSHLAAKACHQLFQTPGGPTYALVQGFRSEAGHATAPDTASPGVSTASTKRAGPSTAIGRRAPGSMCERGRRPRRRARPWPTPRTGAPGKRLRLDRRHPAASPACSWEAPPAPRPLHR
jgi:hypothetical protein